jgi:hypothetical protein
MCIVSTISAHTCILSLLCFLAREYVSFVAGVVLVSIGVIALRLGLLKSFTIFWSPCDFLPASIISSSSLGHGTMIVSQIYSPRRDLGGEELIKFHWVVNCDFLPFLVLDFKLFHFCL